MCQKNKKKNIVCQISNRKKKQKQKAKNEEDVRMNINFYSDFVVSLF